MRNLPASSVVSDLLSGSNGPRAHIADMGHIARTDAELVEASRRGEREAFGHLVTRYQDLVCAVSYSSTGNWALSEDVAQETFLAAWRQLAQLREVGRLRSWLCGIARNLARKARKRGARAGESCEEVSDELPALEGNPFDATAQAEVDRVVREALARVPETYRETLVLYYCENRSVREVAEVLGIAEANAMQRLTRGRRFLADSIGALVERSLRSTRRSKSLAALVVAALPAAVPSRVDASTHAEGSTMLKIAIAASVFVAAGTTAAVVHHVRSSASEGSPPATLSASSTPHCASGLGPQAAPARTPNARPKLPAAVASAKDDAKVVDPATIQRLALDRGPSRGPATAPVTIVLFQDLMCSYCGAVLGTLDQLWDEYPGKLRLVIKQMPVHSQARLAAEASFAADAQGKFWEMHDLMIAHQEDLSRDALLDYGKQAGMDVGKLAYALDHHTYAGAVEKDMDSASEVGVHATPEMLINGQDVRGALPVEAFRAAIDAALAN